MFSQANKNTSSSTFKNVRGSNLLPFGPEPPPDVRLGESSSIIHLCCGRWRKRSTLVYWSRQGHRYTTAAVYPPGGFVTNRPQTRLINKPITSKVLYQHNESFKATDQMKVFMFFEHISILIKITELFFPFEDGTMWQQFDPEPG